MDGIFPPSVYSYREKIEVEGTPISREQFAKHTTRVAAVIEEMTAEGLAHPTPFEIETAVAFLFFAEEKCDLVILEVGMGGNLDATNIIRNTVLAVLVPISMDHQAFLGNTLSEIAEKKAGIIKPGCSVVTVGQQPETMAVIERVCRENGADLTEADLHEAKAVKKILRDRRWSTGEKTMSWHWQDLIRRRMQHLHWRHLRRWDESDIRQQLNSEKKV